MQKVKDALPDTKLAFISINTSPSRWKQVEKVKEANRQIAALAAKDDKLIFMRHVFGDA